MAQRMPAVFLGHGNPMNAISTNVYTRGWSAIGAKLPRPRAVLAVSAHWYVPHTSATAMEAPRTIHDFGGFPVELHEVVYPAPGDPALARSLKALLSPTPVGLDSTWGLDHGTWSVLRHVFPKADVPVVQLSIDESRPAAFHYEIGKRLSPLRDEGILIVGSGNVVHNLHDYAWGGEPVEPYEWAVRFERRVRDLLKARDHGPLVAIEGLGQDALLSVPTPDHFLPLLYVAAVHEDGEAVRFPVEGFDGGSISMLSVQFG